MRHPDVNCVKVTLSLNQRATCTITHTQREREREREREGLNKVLFDSHVTRKPVNKDLVNLKPQSQDNIYHAT